MNKKLVAYFSATGTTAKVAARLADTLGAELYEIRPAQSYNQADLDWRDQTSRSTLEMTNAASRPAICGKLGSMDAYGTVFVGFPIWWYKAPTIINTFLEQYDWNGKTVIPFATSGGSDMAHVNENLRASCPGAVLKEGAVHDPAISIAELAMWASRF